ncbi:response regulator [Chitinophaga rhizosphaerae]|uniref:response regulator n=1 Tax=Chitinophaga rhizosphaerae TaxID=1864947 RepID=UPI000F80919F|nr:response regulator [Chitinophaga rhizosphaerae]
MTTAVPNLLLIDDDADDQEIFLSALAFIDNSIRCSLASNGQEGISHLDASESLPDLIFLDLNMPVMNGMQFLQELKTSQRTKHIPVIIYSTASDQHTIRQALELGAFQFYTKPEKFSELVSMLHSLLYPATR